MAQAPRLSRLRPRADLQGPRPLDAPVLARFGLTSRFVSRNARRSSVALKRNAFSAPGTYQISNAHNESRRSLFCGRLRRRMGARINCRRRTRFSAASLARDLNRKLKISRSQLRNAAIARFHYHRRLCPLSLMRFSVSTACFAARINSVKNEGSGTSGGTNGEICAVAPLSFKPGSTFSCSRSSNYTFVVQPSDLTGA